MFKRLVFEDYAAICTMIAFAVVALVFLGAIWRALCLSRPQSEHMAALPFELDAPPPPHAPRCTANAATASASAAALAARAATAPAPFPTKPLAHDV